MCYQFRTYVANIRFEGDDMTMKHGKCLYSFVFNVSAIENDINDDMIDERKM